MNSIIYPKCEKEGYHIGETMNQICLEKGCRNQSLCCNICISDSHKNHQQRPIKLLIHEIQQKIERGGDSLEPAINQQELLNLVELNKQNLIGEFNAFTNKWIQEAQQIEKKYGLFFDSLKEGLVKSTEKPSNAQIQQVIDSIFNTESTIQQLQSKILQLLDNQPQLASSDGKEVQLLDHQELQESIKKTCDGVQKQLILKNSEISDIISKQSELIDQTLKEKILSNKIFFQQALDFVFQKSKNSTSLITHEEGIEYETKGSSQLIYSEKTFETGVHGYTMQMMDFKENTSSCFLIGVYEETDALANKNTGNHPWACLFNGCRGKMTPDNKNFGQYIKKGDTIKVNLDIENNAYSITDGKEQLKYTLTENSYIFKGKKLKFFISFYSSDCKVRLKIVESF